MDIYIYYVHVFPFRMHDPHDNYLVLYELMPRVVYELVVSSFHALALLFRCNEARNCIWFRVDNMHLLCHSSCRGDSGDVKCSYT